MNNPIADSTIKVTCDHYQKLLAESSFIEQELSSFASALSKSLIGLALRDADWRPPSIPEIRQLRQNVTAMMDNTRDRLQRECTTIIEVTASIRKLSHEFKQLIDIMRSEQERSTQKISDLVGQLRSKELEIEKCQIAVENQRNKRTEQAWRRMHYITIEAIGGEEPAGVTYLKVLKDLRDKMDEEVNVERREQRNFTAAMMERLKDFKSKLLKIWQLLPCSKPPNCRPGSPSDEQMKRQISELQRRYLKREQEIDEFQVGDLLQIKKKLKLLEEAEMSESREYLGYSLSGEQQNLIESEVVQLINS